MLALKVAVLLVGCLQFGANAVENNVAITEDAFSKINVTRRRFNRRYQHLYYGETGTRSDFPYLVRVRWNSPDTPTTCAGALVTAVWVVASAACFKEAATRMRKANKTLTWQWPKNCTMTGDGQTVKVEEIRIHDEYLRKDPKSDVSIAALKGGEAFFLNDRVNVANLSQPMPGRPPGTVYACRVSGYGQWNGTDRRHPSTRQISWYNTTAGDASHCQRLENDALKVDVATARELLRAPTYSDMLCCARADDMPKKWGEVTTCNVEGDMGGVLTCNVEGDMGGVLTCNGRVVGVTAWMTFNVCVPNMPKGATVYTNIGHPTVYKWLKSVVPNLPKLHRGPRGKNRLWRSNDGGHFSGGATGRRCSSNTRCYVGITVVTFAVIVLLY